MDHLEGRDRSRSTWCLFLGVLYHLPNPLLALERVAAVTDGLLMLETVVDMVGIGRPAAAFYPGELNSDPTNWWGPNQAAVQGMLKRGIRARRDHAAAVRGVSRRARGVAQVKGKNELPWRSGRTARCSTPSRCRQGGADEAPPTHQQSYAAELAVRPGDSLAP